ncbi:MAG TPA: hypothetical protein VFN19_00455, partial [Candidatus Nanopelagicales bacterium]|nr:hypothetical protein [Candidatus Nanopelagicales bacterium]
LIVGVQYSLVAVGASGISLLTTIQRTRSVMGLRVSQAVARLPIAAVVAALVGTAAALAVAETFVVLYVAVASWWLATTRASGSVAREGTPSA